MYINIYIQGDNSLLTKNRKSISICANCLLSKTFNQILKFQASEEREEAIICQFKGYSGPPTNIIGRGKLAPSVPMSMALNMVGYCFDEGKRLTIRKLGQRSFGVVDYIVWGWL